MISLTNNIPFFDTENIQFLKINCNFSVYSDDKDACFYIQENGGDITAIVCFIDRNMIIYDICADYDELKNFISVISPDSIFSNPATAEKLGLQITEKIFIMKKNPDVTESILGDELSSKDLYNLLNVDGLELPLYEYFATDFCRRKNHGFSDYFGIKNKCAAISLKYGNSAIITGITSTAKGYGRIALSGILAKNNNKCVFACCRENVKKFYLKFGFYEAGQAVYSRRL